MNCVPRPQLSGLDRSAPLTGSAAARQVKWITYTHSATSIGNESKRTMEQQQPQESMPLRPLTSAKPAAEQLLVANWRTKAKKASGPKHGKASQGKADYVRYRERETRANGKGGLC